MFLHFSFPGMMQTKVKKADSDGICVHMESKMNENNQRCTERCRCKTFTLEKSI